MITKLVVLTPPKYPNGVAPAPVIRTVAFVFTISDELCMVPVALSDREFRMSVPPLTIVAPL